MSNEMAEKAMKLVANMDRSEDKKDLDEEGKLQDEGLDMAAEEMMDAMQNNDSNSFVLALKNFLSIAKS